MHFDIKVVETSLGRDRSREYRTIRTRDRGSLSKLMDRDRIGDCVYKRDLRCESRRTRTDRTVVVGGRNTSSLEVTRRDDATLFTVRCADGSMLFAGVQPQLRSRSLRSVFERGRDWRLEARGCAMESVLESLRRPVDEFVGRLDRDLESETGNGA